LSGWNRPLKKEKRNMLGFDDREPSEFVDIFLGKNEQKD
jgi:hypothetical protein